MKFARIYLDLDRKGAKSSFLQRLLIQHVFLGFNWHDLEGKKKHVTVTLQLRRVMVPVRCTNWNPTWHTTLVKDSIGPPRCKVRSGKIDSLSLWVPQK